MLFHKCFHLDSCDQNQGSSGDVRHGSEEVIFIRLQQPLNSKLPTGSSELMMSSGRKLKHLWESRQKEVLLPWFKTFLVHRRVMGLNYPCLYYCISAIQITLPSLHLLNWEERLETQMESCSWWSSPEMGYHFEFKPRQKHYRMCWKKTNQNSDDIRLRHNKASELWQRHPVSPCEGAWNHNFTFPFVYLWES